VHANRSARTIAAARDGIMFTCDGLAATAEPAEDAWLAECLDLTAAESRVAGLLLAGHDTFAIASRLGISRGTVRRYLEQLTSKTGTHRQAELVRLLGQVAAMCRATGEGSG
jgi:DNA-binding CsgD family transcriptional regulator